MFARLSNAVVHLFSTQRDHAHDAYFASSSDLADLERCMRQVDEDDHAYSMRFCGSVARDRDFSASNF
ncbi:DUF3563 family protein [Candidatus Burkholderia verschuerenii]|uniref:DUF3563 family protein n=1 Tax=Candidatus Burkholderia verschuerenii TaxID=242163 RepID=UPI00067D4E42|nr:DUF3563 family protein [Candidatus Burkholderia verschuerenii]